MKLTWILHNYVPVILAGAELNAHRLNRWLSTQGWEITVMIHNRNAQLYPNVYEGIQIQTLNTTSLLGTHFRDCDCIATQLWCGNIVYSVASQFNKPVIYFYHFVDQTVVPRVKITYLKSVKTLYVYNSQDRYNRAIELGSWLKNEPHMIMNPIVWPGGTDFPPRDCVLPHRMVQHTPLSFEDPFLANPSSKKVILLVNFSRDKGGEAFQQLAELCSRRDILPGGLWGSSPEFVAIKGSHGTQLEPTDKVKLLEPQLPEQMDIIWRKTYLLCIMSKYETWSMAATEAMTYGIPVLCADHIPALRENCGSAGIYLPLRKPEDLSKWVDMIHLLTGRDPQSPPGGVSPYQYYSELALQRSKLLCPLTSLNQFINFYHENTQKN